MDCFIGSWVANFSLFFLGGGGEGFGGLVGLLCFPLVGWSVGFLLPCLFARWLIDLFVCSLALGHDCGPTSHNRSVTENAAL